LIPTHRSISGLFVEILKKVAGEQGLVLGEADIRLKHSLVAANRFNTLVEAIAARAGDPNLGLHLGERFYSSATAGLLAGLIANSPTLGQALENLSRYHDLMGDYFQLVLSREGARVRLTWQVREQDFHLDRHVMEGIIGSTALRLRGLAEGEFRFTNVFFSHPQPQDTREHARLFGCPCHFGQAVNALELKEDELHCRIFLADPALLRKLENLARKALRELAQGEWSRNVIQSLQARLPAGEPCTLAAVASELAVSSRHLQEKLKEEGTFFRQLLDQLRKKMAADYIREPGVSLYDVAFMLGFTEQSAFNHAFKRWTGSTPNKYRTEPRRAIGKKPHA
jgi:AraC-like DNA-binding protein